MNVSTDTAARARLEALIGEWTAVDVGQLFQQFGLSLRVDGRRAGLGLVLGDRPDELEAAVQNGQNLTVQSRDLVAQVAQVRVGHGRKSARTPPRTLEKCAVQADNVLSICLDGSWN